MASIFGALCPKGLSETLLGLLLRPAVLCWMPVPVHVLLLLHLSPASGAGLSKDQSTHLLKSTDLYVAYNLPHLPWYCKRPFV